MNNDLAIIILAAGQGTRMQSARPKVMHEIAGQPMIAWVRNLAESLNPAKIITVIAPEMDEVTAAVHPHETVVQAAQLGTANAVQTAMDALEDFTGNILVLYGDGPLYQSDTLKEFLAGFAADEVSKMSFLGMALDDPTGYGRMVSQNGQVTQIIEEKDADSAQKDISLCWTGVMCAAAELLRDLLPKVDNNNHKGEYYLTALPALGAVEGVRTSYALCPEEEAMGANTRAELAALEQKMQARLRAQAMESGVCFLDPESVYLSFDTEIGAESVIEPNVFFGTGVCVGQGVSIHAFSHIEGANIDDGASIGPFARIRPKSTIGVGASVGNFSEINRSELKPGAKSKHLSYLGDSVIGEKVNIGAGTVIANYDGFEKHQTTIATGAFVGSNSTIIAPCEIGAGAIVAAGSTINKNVPADGLGLARGKQQNLDGWAAIYREKKQKDKGKK